eukprot:evm.model.NODE_18009_length_20417_cov_32.100063.3
MNVYAELTAENANSKNAGIYPVPCPAARPAGKASMPPPIIFLAKLTMEATKVLVPGGAPMVAVALLLPPPPPRTCDSSSARDGMRGRELECRELRKCLLCKSWTTSLLLLMELEAAGARKKTDERTARTRTAMRTGSGAIFTSCRCVNGGACGRMVRVTAHCVVNVPSISITTSKGTRSLANGERDLRPRLTSHDARWCAFIGLAS